VAEGDRERWDATYCAGGHADPPPPEWLAAFDAELPRTGRALDVASGTGRLARFWAARGLATLAVDVSPEGLRIAREAAAAAGLALDTRALDLEREPLPDGPFAAISCFHYLQRDLFPALAARLAPGGVLACEIATLRNLERNPKPSARFLLQPNELLALCRPLEVVFYAEGWQDDRALARLLATRPGRAATAPAGP
jgi:tellurite methyltransferase